MSPETLSAPTALGITPEQGLVLYEDMVLGRMFEDKCAEMYYKGKMFGFVHLYNGQEAVSTGVSSYCAPMTTPVAPIGIMCTP